MTDDILDGQITPQFLSQQEEMLFAEATLGIDAIKFLNSDLGRVIRGYALQEREDAKDKLLSVWPWRKRKIQQLQFQAAVANQFLDFISEAITRGKIAEMNLRQMRDQ